MSVLRILSVTAIIGLAVVVYLLLIRPWQLRWGATDKEISRSMPGDELVPDQTFNATRAVSIIATYVIHTMEPNRFLVWADANEGGGAFTWGLYPVDKSHTRLIFRFRFRHSWIDWLLTDWADHVAVRKMLLGVKDRVEGRAEPMALQNAEIALWGVAFLEFIAAIILVFKRQRGWLIALATMGVLLIVLFLHPPLWIGVLLEIGILAGLIWSYRSSKRRAYEPVTT